ncbi:class F sortase [Streptomyces sp. NPDC000983]|uniref:class F sortase n=1 Tax=Streptomyces sp. NPDC000983 TaxID=3154373 RepID=UPI00331FAFC0
MHETSRHGAGLAVVAAAAVGVTVALAATAVALLTAPPSSSGPASRPADFGPSAVEANGRPAPAAPVTRLPQRILVDAVGLDARVRPVGVTGNGAVAVPPDPDVAGWYRFGPAPGSPTGSAVLVGHVDAETGDLGEFAALYDVRPGQRVEVRRAGAEPVLYRVTSRTTVPRERLAPTVFRRTGAPALTLVTCAPPFVPDRGGYLSNLVVTARPVGR